MEHNLTIEERQKFWQSLDTMQKTAAKVDKLYIAVVGDSELKQDGILTRLEHVESKLRQWDKVFAKGKGYIAGATAVGGVMGSIITLLVKSIFKI